MSGGRLERAVPTGTARIRCVVVSGGALADAALDPNSDHVVAIPQGGTGASTASGARDALGVTAELAGKADLVDGKVPASQIPGAYDDVLSYDNQTYYFDFDSFYGIC